MVLVTENINRNVFLFEVGLTPKSVSLTRGMFEGLVADFVQLFGL
jgi:hypothetical protein